MSVVKPSIFLFIAGLLVLFSTNYKFNSRLSAEVKNYPQSVFSSKGVTNKIIGVDLKAEVPQFNNESTLITAYLTAPFNIDTNLSYRWKLSEGVQILDGDLKGLITSVYHSNSKKIQIKVYGFSKEKNSQIGFEIYGLKNGKNITGNALIASDLENTFENIVQNVERIKADQ